MIFVVSLADFVDPVIRIGQSFNAPGLLRFNEGLARFDKGF